MTQLTQRFLVIYSAVVTVAFMLTVSFGAYKGFVQPVQGGSRVTDFDRIRVHRIDVVEPDGTERLVLSNRTDYPGSFFHGKEIARIDRTDAAGLLFIDDEGSEDGGLIYGGLSKDGKPMSFGHLSFDQYEQDQTLSLGSSLDDGKKTTAITISDRPDSFLTPQMITEVENVKAMPDGPAKQAAWAAVIKKYPFGEQRVSLKRSPDGSAGLTLSDTAGHPRLKLMVAVDGSPQIQFLDAAGHVVKTEIAATK